VRVVRVDTATLWRYLPGDLLAIVAFVLVGQFRHGTLIPGRFVGVLAPFLAGWVLVAPIAGVYRPGCRESVPAAAGWAVLAWLPAAVLAQALRATPAFPGDAAPSFFAATLVAGGGALAVWRSVATVVARHRGSGT